MRTTIKQRPDLCSVTTHNKATVYWFHSVEAAVAASEAARNGDVKPLDAANDEWQQTRVVDTDARAVSSPDWCEGMTNEQAIAAITNPPKQRRELIGQFETAEFAAAFRPSPRRRLVKRLDDGDAIDAVRYATEFTVEGVWSKRMRSSSPRPVVRVMVNGAANCLVKSVEFARAAAAVLSAVRSAEDCGYAVEVWWANVQEVGNGRMASVVCLKRIEDAFDWTTMVGVAVGATFFRTVGFDLINLCADGAHHGGYGYPSRWDTAWGEFDLVSPATFKSDEDAKRWLESAVATLDKAAAGGAVAA